MKWKTEMVLHLLNPCIKIKSIKTGFNEFPQRVQFHYWVKGSLYTSDSAEAWRKKKRRRFSSNIWNWLEQVATVSEENHHHHWLWICWQQSNPYCPGGGSLANSAWNPWVDFHAACAYCDLRRRESYFMNNSKLETPNNSWPKGQIKRLSEYFRMKCTGLQSRGPCCEDQWRNNMLFVIRQIDENFVTNYLQMRS